MLTEKSPHTYASSGGLANSVSTLATSPGIAIGPIRLLQSAGNITAMELTQISPAQIEAERQRLQQALDAAVQELRQLVEQVTQTVGRNEADIFEAQQLMLQDPDLLAEVEELLTQQHLSAASALWQVTERQAQELASLESAVLAARAADMRDVAARAMRHLQASEETITSIVLPSPSLIVAYDLSPSDTASLNPHEILGICTVVGGPTTHAAILARALEIPAVAGIDPQLLHTLHNDQIVAIDGTQGRLYLALTAQQQDEFRTHMHTQQQERHERRIQNEGYWRNRPASTADGHPVQILANVGDIESARVAGELGADGIGLLRTEFLFGGRSIFPDEHEQFASYVALFRTFANASVPGATIVARTLDAGADKPFPALEPLIGTLHEANPALGLRGARIHLAHEELLRLQLRALLRAGATTQVQLQIMFPMICTLEEVRRLRAIYTQVSQELETEGIALRQDRQVGIMIETPAAALMADVLAREVDFLSIGANDLFQYTMAADRTNSRVMSLFGVLEPAVWRLIENIIRAGKTYGKTVTLCGELAADPQIGPLLTGLGMQELSMSPAAIVRVKAALHTRSMAYWQQQAQALLKAETAAEMQIVLEALL